VGQKSIVFAFHQVPSGDTHFEIIWISVTTLFNSQCFPEQIIFLGNQYTLLEQNCKWSSKSRIYNKEIIAKVPPKFQGIRDSKHVLSPR